MLEETRSAVFKLASISPDTVAFPWAQRTPAAGLQSIFAIGLALLLGHATGHDAAASIAAGAAFTVGFAAFHEALASTLLSMVLLTLGIASATLAGSLAAPWTPAVLALSLLAAVNYGLLAAVGPTAGWIGQQCAVFLVISAFFPKGPHYAFGRAGMVVLGGVLQMVVFTAFHFFEHPTLSRESLPARFQARVRHHWDLLLEQTHWGTDTVSYVLRLALVMLVTTFTYRHYHVRNGYWTPMTALLVLKPQWTGTVSRGVARLFGTVLGVGLALLLARTTHLHNAEVLALAIGCAWGCYALQAVNYAAFSFFLTLYTVFLFRFGGFSDIAAAHVRAFNTALGGSLALAVDIVWLGAARLLGHREQLTPAPPVASPDK